MHADSHFTIGKTHKVCQDYARAGKATEGKAFAILSDGCSSSPDTDLGARLLTLTTANSFQLSWLFTGWDICHEDIALAARDSLGELAPLEALDATLLVAKEGPGGVGVTVIGDGVVACLRKDGVLEVIDVNYKNAPGYLSYYFSPGRWETYLKQGCNKRTITWYTSEGLTSEDQEVTMENLAWTHFFPTAEYKVVFLFSDGVHSFRKDNGLSWDSVSMTEVVEQLTAIKGATGAFVQRRMQAFENRFCRDNHWQHDDDLAMASIWMEN